MKLFAHPGASSMSVHILLRELGTPFELEIVDVKTKLRADGSGYGAIAERGLVPLLVLPDGATITENAVIAQYLCDSAGRVDLMLEAGSIARYVVLEWQGFIAAELDKAFAPLFWPIGEEERSAVRQDLRQRFATVDGDLDGRDFLTGETFTAADAYMFVIASWASFFQVDLSGMPALRAYLVRIGRRSSVAAALAAEGPGFVSLLAD